MPVSASAKDSTAGRAAVPATSGTFEGHAESVSGGIWHTCAIREDGRLGCWGDGELGQATPPTGTFTSLDSGPYYNCAIRTDGRLACWGYDDQGQVRPPAGRYTAVSAGADHACAIRLDGTVTCWGSDQRGQLHAPAGTFSQLSAGGFFTCAIRTDGTLACWGDADTGATSPPGGTFTALGAGHWHACAVRTDGTLACWGLSGPTPQGSFTAVGGGYEYSCAIRADSTLACWGAADSGVTVPPAGAFRAIGTGYLHSCAIRDDGTVACWGYGEQGQLVPRPSVSVGGLAMVSAKPSIRVTWLGRSPLNVVTGYDIRYRRARWNGGFGARVAWLSGTTATSATFAVAPGYTYCFSVRATDVVGASRWTDETCTSVPVDDRGMVRSAGWVAGTGPAYYRSTYLRSSRYGATLSLRGVVAQDVVLLATTCRSCGWVRVYWNSTLVRRVNLYSYDTANRVAILVGEFGSVRVGRLTVRVSTADGGKAIIDGVAISHR